MTSVDLFGQAIAPAGRRTPAGAGFVEAPAATHVWLTPPEIYVGLGLAFDLDPCAPATPIPWAPVRERYALPQDGRVLPWFGLVWLNPPYDDVEHFLARMSEHRNGVALLFARTDTAWFHDYIAEADAVLFLAGRVRFLNASHVREGSPAAPSMLVAWGPVAVQAFRDTTLRGPLVPARGAAAVAR